MKKIAIIGAGISGLSLATLLKNKAEITVFDKARGVGGRMSTRRWGQHSFDHGAPFFSANSDHFKQFLQQYIDSGVVQKWQPSKVIFDRDKPERLCVDADNIYVASPAMNSLCKALSVDLDIELNREITATKFTQDKWRLLCNGELHDEAFDWLICTAPAAQAASLVAQNLTNTSLANNYQMTPCFTVMSAFDKMPPLEFELAEFCDSDVQRIVVNHVKPGRKQSPSIVIQSTASWAAHQIESPPVDVLNHLLQHAHQLTGINFAKTEHNSLHRWLYAGASQQSLQNYLIEPTSNLGLCADWFANGTVDCAFNSAHALAEQLGPLLE
jgi:predicted NAD/FAD-dependent oxidoreductase